MKWKIEDWIVAIVVICFCFIIGYMVGFIRRPTPAVVKSPVYNLTALQSGKISQEDLAIAISFLKGDKKEILQIYTEKKEELKRLHKEHKQEIEEARKKNEKFLNSIYDKRRDEAEKLRHQYWQDGYLHGFGEGKRR